MTSDLVHFFGTGCAATLLFLMLLGAGLGAVIHMVFVKLTTLWSNRRDLTQLLALYRLVVNRANQRDAERIDLVVLGYCVRCREKRVIQDAKRILLANTRWAAKGHCVNCGGMLMKFLPTIRVKAKEASMPQDQDWQKEWTERGIESEMPDIVVSGSEELTIEKFHRLTADQNGPSPGQAKVWLRVVDAVGCGVRGLKVHFTTEPSEGIAYEHINAWGTTDEKGRLGFSLKTIATRWIMTCSDGDRVLLVVGNIRTDLGNEYRRGGVGRGNWRPCCTPGRYSFWVDLRFIGE